MSLKSSNKISSNEYELEVAVSAEEFNKEVEKVYKREIKKISVPGFRKGKAPKALVEKYYGEGVFYEDAIKNLYPEALLDAAKEAGIEIIADNKIDVIKSDKTEGLVFKATVTTMPEVKIGNYKGIEVEKMDLEVTDEDVEKEIEEVRIRNSRLVTVEDRPAKEGDSVVIDFEGFMNGKAFEGGKADNFTLEIGKKQFIEGFESQIIGHNTGDKFDINVRFPDDYHAKDYAGKDAVFKINLHEIKERELPELNDDFVKDVSECDTLDEYKESLRKKVAEDKKDKADVDRENKIVEKLAELVEADIPEVMITRKLNDIIQEFSYRLQSQGVSMSDYAKFTGSSVDEMKSGFRPQAETQVKLGLAFRKISEIENIVPTQEDIDKEYKRVAKNYNIEESKIKTLIPLKDIIEDIKSQKVIELVKDNVVEK